MPSRVADIYRVVKPSVRTWSRPVAVVLGAWIVAVLLGAWSAPEIRAFLVERDELPLGEPLVEAALAVEGAAEAAGLLPLRRQLESGVQPIKRPAIILGRKSPPRPPEASTPDPLPAEPEGQVQAEPEPAGPGERWVSPADEGGDRVERILMVGASSIQYYLGTELERAIKGRYSTISVHRKGKLGTGLVRDDVFDWQAEVSALIEEHRPQVVLCQFGGNDAQPILVEGRKVSVGAPGWEEAYEERVVAMAELIRDAGALPVFLGMPIMRDKGFTGRVERVNKVTQRAVERTGARYIDLWDLAASPDGGYRIEVEVGGRRTLMRLEDGIHFTRAGAQYLAENLIRRLEQQLPLVPDDDLAIAIPSRIDSQARGRSVPHLAFVPREVPPEGLPVLVLLHGAYGGWTDWSERAHEDLRRLAKRHRLILVLADGDPFGWYLDSDEVPGAKIHTYLVDELLPSFARDLPVSGPVSMMGLSMGGHGALITALRRPGLLTSASSISGALDLAHARSRKQLQERLGLYESNPKAWHEWSVLHRLQSDPDPGLPIKMTCGREDKVWVQASRDVHRVLVDAGVEHAYVEVSGGHTWEVWSGALPDHVAFHAEHLHHKAP
ncbi:MAG: DUF459 domain-containing protein [Deltaproteobacteria bacterium]|nr:MAG: DUF459 domain-containing protein [Deltaproteobacteria bacterium]